MHRLIRTPVLIVASAVAVTSIGAGVVIHRSLAADPQYPMTTVAESQMVARGITLRSSNAPIAVTRDQALRVIVTNYWPQAQIREAVHVHMDATSLMQSTPDGRLKGQPFHGEVWAVSVIPPGGIRAVSHGPCTPALGVCPSFVPRGLGPLVPPGSYDLIWIDAQTGGDLGETAAVPAGY